MYTRGALWTLESTIDLSQLFEIARVMAFTYVLYRSPNDASPNPTPACPAPVENCPYANAGRPPSPYGTALEGGAGGATFVAGAGCGGFGLGVIFGAVGNGTGSAALSGTGGGAGSVLDSPGDSFAGALSFTTSGAGNGTPETLLTILALIPPAPPDDDPQLGAELGKILGEMMTKAKTIP
jgi:hypothetical protein